MNRIKELRLKNNISQVDLAKLFGVTRQAISLYEQGKRQLKDEDIIILAKYFEVSIPYLKGYMVCTRCQGYFIPENDIVREQIECCPYCMNPYFEGDKQ
ncbi:helix-turn-helix domain-containing protein [Lactobacillus johnsonii]|uniref:helix-turn-helix domain-containing protein n=1 Tax=Lactobacillus johnsonii TaxID=33959 RepID=UPI001C11A2D8|nr:helix-turn-helix transcriptional regulator [Lactobacillus johnsonii]MBU5318973.1 helix-turn-helix domain-containing protein [Lactobacillus johnsonii]